MRRCTNIQEKYDTFMKIYDEGIEMNVPFCTVKPKRNNTWFNWKCEAAKRNRNKAWRNKNRTNANNRDKYIKVRNEYIKIRREE